MSERSPAVRLERVSLCDTLDRLLNCGVVVQGEIVISVAGVDLLYLDTRLLLAAVDAAAKAHAYNPGGGEA